MTDITVTPLARSRNLTIIAVRHPEDFRLTPENCGAMAIFAERLRTLDKQDARLRAERDRLRAERDWLAGSMAEDGCPYLAFWADLYEDMRPDWCICTDTADDGFDCTGDPKECWQQEAARRAVAAGEGE